MIHDAYAAKLATLPRPLVSPNEPVREIIDREEAARIQDALDRASVDFIRLERDRQGLRRGDGQ